MRFERENKKPIEPVSERQLRRQLSFKRGGGALRLSVPLVLLLFVACGGASPRPADNGNSATPARQTPIALEDVRAAVERQADWGRLRKAACPRRIPDRHEERRRYPAIDALDGLEYVIITDDTSRGSYEKVIELTSAGRRNLQNELEEEAEKYIIAIARREYLPGTERFNPHPQRSDRLAVEFRWQWKPLNPLGERMSLRAHNEWRLEHHGRATYERVAEQWQLKEVWLESDGRNYLHGVSTRQTLMSSTPCAL